MSRADYRRHPVVAAVWHATNGRRALPSEPELDALRLSPGIRRQVQKACAEVAELHEAGLNQKARSLAEERAGEILDALPPEIADNNEYLRPAEDPLTEYDPATLAAAVSRW